MQSKQLLFILFLMSVITTIIVDLCVTQIHNKNNKDKDQAGEKWVSLIVAAAVI